MTSSTVAVTGAWAAAAALPGAASWYGQHDGAVRLDDTGRVLVAGGADAASAALDQAAIHDPVNGWGPAGHLRTHRKLHTVTRLNDGSVLVAGGLSGSSEGGPGLASAERYNPTTNDWDPTDSMAEPRWGHSAVLLDDGSVLVAGGSALRSGQTTKALRSVERYVPGTAPGTGKWSSVADMTDARTGHIAVPLAGGLILVCGGTTPVGAGDDVALAFCELYDTQQKEWRTTGSLRQARHRHQATLVSAGTVLVTGGAAPGAGGDGPFDPFSQRTAELYDVGTGVWTAVRDMPAGRALHRAVPFGTGQVLVVGGAASERDEAGYRSAVLFDSTANNWSAVAGLDTGRWAFAIAPLPENRVLVAGGVLRSGLAAADPAVTELTATAELFTGGPS